MHLTAHLDFDVVAVETDDEVTLLLELTAPANELADGPRPPATLQIVLDRSGSMAEGDRLAGAQRALLTLVDRLDPTDNFGLVTFDDEVQVVVPAGPLSDKDTVRAAIAGLYPGGMTNLSAGYQRGLQEARRVAGPTRATVLLISDGHANEGVTDHDQLRRIARGGHGKGVGTTTLGYGLGYDEELLGAVADGGAGEALFAEDPDTAGKLIAGEVDGLLSKSAQAASLLIKMQSPVAAVAVLGGMPSTQLPDGSVMVELGDFWSAETRKLLLKFAVPAMAALGLATIAELVFTYVELPSLDSHTVTIPVTVNIVPGDEATGRMPNAKVRTEVVFTEAQEAKRQASEALRRGETGVASDLFRSAGLALGSAIPMAAPDQADELTAEVALLAELADRAEVDDASRTSKASYASYHSSTRKRGRGRTASRGDDDRNS